MADDLFNPPVAPDDTETATSTLPVIPTEKTPPATKDDDDRERWSWHDNDSVILDTQPATAVYRNRNNGVVVRQEDTAPHSGTDDDQFVFFSTDAAVLKLIEALAAEIGVELTIGRRGRRS